MRTGGVQRVVEARERLAHGQQRAPGEARVPRDGRVAARGERHVDRRRDAPRPCAALQVQVVQPARARGRATLFWAQGVW